MARTQSKARSYIEYAGVLALYPLLAWLPLALSKAIVFVIADVWRFFDKRHRARIVTRMMERLDIGRAEAKRLTKANYRHYLMVFMEVARLRGMSLPEIDRRTERNGVDHMIRELIARGKGLVLVTGHLGNWEWAAIALGRLNAVDGAIARPLNNPFIDEFINNVRSKSGMAVWRKNGSMRHALAALKRARGVVAVADQNGGRRGRRSLFLGKECSSIPTPVDLAIRTGAPILVGAMMRTREDLRFGMVSKRVHWPREDADPDEERMRLLAAMNDDLSAIIREYPEQWIWIHDRWKMPASLGS